MFYTVILCSIGAAVQGWDQVSAFLALFPPVDHEVSTPLTSAPELQTGTNGANLSFPQEFGIGPVEGDPAQSDKNEWILGVVNAGPYIACAFLGCWLADPATKYLGRRGCIFISAIFCLFPGE